MIRRTAALLLLFAACARADILVRTDNSALEGKILEQSPTEVVIQPAGAPPLRIPAAQVSRILPVDEHGALRATARSPRRLPSPPPEPAAPPVATPPPAGNTYYLIPLHGEVGATILASALDKSLADAALRQPTVVVLDIDSPGGLVDEAAKILKVLHTYNRRLRIVALTDKDLSAAAIFTLSVKEIYMKPGSTLGAAVSFIPSKLFLPPKLEEKFQSAWRAVARSSAEEGGHNPLLADAMIDPSHELRIIHIDGKPAVVEAPPLPNQPSLLAKGKILTLTASEAVATGLAAGKAEDLDDLARQLHLAPWTECKGLATPLADAIEKRAVLFKTEIDKIGADLLNNLLKAQVADPGQSIHVNISNKPAPAPIAAAATPAAWTQRSLLAVVYLQDAEEDLRDAIALARTFDQETTAETLTGLLDKVCEGRAGIYDRRNSFGEVAARPAAPVNPSTSDASPPNTANLPRPALPPAITTLNVALQALASPSSEDQSRGAKFLLAAPVDPAQQKKITTALLPLFKGPDTNRQYIFFDAFSRWASKDDVPTLISILSTPEKSAATPNPQNRYWPAAITALVRVDPAAAEPVLQQRKSEFYFRSKISFALQSLIDANGPEKPAAQHLLEILRPPAR